MKRTASRAARAKRAAARTLLALTLLAVGLITGPPANAAAPTVTSLLDSIRAEADWILFLRDGTGAIATKVTRDYVVPYQANLAAEGLARAYKLTLNQNYSIAAWRWLEWYRDHQSVAPDTKGTITNYYKASGSWVSTGTLDSTDAYAGTYLSAAREVFEATGDLNRLMGIKGALDLAVDAIELTQDADGLHTAKPGWPFRYTMDEAETYYGLRAAEDLYTVLGDYNQRTRVQTEADRLLSGSAVFIDPHTGLYLWAIHTDGTRVPASIDWIYPGASAQAWAIAYGLATGAQAQSLMARVAQAQPDWSHPNATTQYYPGLCYSPLPANPPPCIRPVNYWVRFSLAYLALGESSRARDTALSIRDAAIQNGRAFPFTPADAGQLIMVLSDPHVLAETAGVPI